MKLWQKISILCVGILLIIMIVCNIFSLLEAKQSLLDFAITQAQAEQRTLTTSFFEMTRQYLQNETNPIVKRSEAKHYFSLVADESDVLVTSGELLYSSIDLRPQDLLAIDPFFHEDQQVYLNTFDNRNILIIGSGLKVNNDLYLIYTVKDITGVYNSIAALTWRFVLIGGCGLLAGTLLIVWLVRRASIPLMRLKESARRIAIGDYSERAQIRSKDEVGELAADFNIMADAVASHFSAMEETTQRQQLFIGGLTHEFKTPMTSMLVHADTLLFANVSQEAATNSLVHIYTQCQWLERLTQKLLKLITLKEEIAVRPEKVLPLLEDVWRSTAETLRERQTPLEIQCETDSLSMDYDLIKSLLINLVDNASKASEPGQSLLMRAYNSTLEIQDKGHGIPADEVAHIMDTFYMVDRSRSKLKGGSGLGLALVKQIADVHNAQMIVESEENIGTTIKVIFDDEIRKELTI
ncbi:MAG: HAMP domain-containing histidine kinase [Peptococcaceae bacterium]|nr:HAMP domain-containing histidine kinase [Peptococcaceae bacterium]